ncbi:regulator of chromosome condensation [Protopterus annectens]|uniref:regulator of chromosome condensation n=1 Tax=Protopterus annectens TaxID=7888 RepID=UPI001CFA9E64|nr:regulator of chromosome condensation [Protopterus annectens]
MPATCRLRGAYACSGSGKRVLNSMGSKAQRNRDGAVSRRAPVKRAQLEEKPEHAEVKKIRVSHPSHRTVPGIVLTLGQGDVGQLGLGESIMERKKPALVNLPEKIVEAIAGGMHTVCLSATGGNDHLVMLTVDGDLYTCGCGEQGQLGRVPERFTSRGGRQGLERLLVPQCIHVKGKGSSRVRFKDVFCGAYFTFAISQDGHIYGFGLSNYHQLGTQNTKSCYTPQNLTSFKNSTKSWVGFSGGQHHTVCFDSEGRFLFYHYVFSVILGHIFSWGMGTNYQLGTGEEDDVWTPVEMTGKQLENRTVISVSSGGQHTVLLVQDN